MSLESISWFSEKTGFTRETVKKRFTAAGLAGIPGPKAATLYETRDGFPALYEAATQAGDQMDVMMARAENLRADTRLKELKEQQMRGELAPIDAMEFALASVCSQIVATLETIPAKLKRRLPQLNASDIDIIRKEIAKARNAAAEVRIDLGPDQSGADSSIAASRVDDDSPADAAAAVGVGV